MSSYTWNVGVLDPGAGSALGQGKSKLERILGATAHPTASGVALRKQANLVMDLEDSGCQARCLIRDRDGKFPQLFDEVPKDAGIEVVLSGVRIPRMNSITERWVQTCRRELLNRTLIWSRRHLLHALREFETFYNEHRPHQGGLRRPVTRRRPTTEPARARRPAPTGWRS
ncbi:integrase core domain-containing protein [Streptomyces sp. NPDC056656]|uniref:integrase core domain-containing protein n=1 Tax=Streptomyces sp. NPDC056656 TaxID=3345895 RepID=UPI0036928EBC